jgi:hypothetical protein
VIQGTSESTSRHHSIGTPAAAIATAAPRNATDIPISRKWNGSTVWVRYV